MKNNACSLSFLRIIIHLFTYIFIALLCSPAMAKSLQVKDQFGNPIENVVVSYSSTGITKSHIVDVAIMDQVDKQFSPQVLVVQKNQTVSFPNSDDIRHHLYSFSKPKSFEFRMFKGGESKNLKFDQTGIVVLGCNIHDQMVGYIYVADNEHTVMTNAQGIADVPQGVSAIKLWHSGLSANKVERKDVQLISSYSTQPLAIMLTLLADIVVPTKNKFGSKKFGRGDH
jgi:plastocyanin